MSSFGRRFQNVPILSWTVDSFEQLYEIMTATNFNLSNYVKQYEDNMFNDNILPLFESAPIKLNLGGKTEKSKLTTTDKPIGIFDFSLAANGLYRVPEYYSYKLEIEKPNKFKEFDLPSGVVPPNLVQQEYILGNKRYYYKDDNTIYDCVIRQKGETAIDKGIDGAKLKFATRNKKVYLTYKRNKGKVKYVEIYSLFYYTSLSGDVEYAIRHIPALMIAEYLESIGVMTRFYMTRFVLLNETMHLRRNDIISDVPLPMYEVAPDKTNRYNLFIQPIIVKEFGQEFDKSLAFCVSSQDYQQIYQNVGNYVANREVTTRNIDIYGYPNWEQEQYFEGIERYRNKYQIYVKEGLFKSKEVLPEAMLFFHDIAIKEYLSRFIDTIRKEYMSVKGKTYTKTEVLTSTEVNPFFNWWMRLSAANLKNKIEIINSNQLRKDLVQIKKEAEEKIEEINKIISDTNDIMPRLVQPFTDFKRLILREYKLIDYSDVFNFNNYILQLTNEITSYADGVFFGTDVESQAIRDGIAQNVINELPNI